MITIGAVSLFLLVLISVLVYTSNLKVLVKLSTLPLLLVMSLLAYGFFLEEVGKPFDHVLPKESTYVFHRVTSEDTIVVWLREDGDNERLYVIPYTREDAKTLEEAKSKSEEGQEQTVRAGSVEGNDEKEGEGGQLSIEGSDVNLDSKDIPDKE